MIYIFAKSIIQSNISKCIQIKLLKTNKSLNSNALNRLNCVNVECESQLAFFFLAAVSQSFVYRNSDKRSAKKTKSAGRLGFLHRLRTLARFS